MRSFFTFLLSLPFLLIAQSYQAQQPPSRVPPENVAQELSQAEAQYQHALTLFNPWYTGPLITPSPSMIAPGQAMLQPYIYFTDTYGTFNAEREWVDAPNEFTIKTQPIILEIGVTQSVDVTLVMGTLAQWKQHQFSGGFQDTSLQVGFLVQPQTIYVPQFKFSIGESFPTGKYKNLDPDNLGLDSTGAGAWGTTFTLTAGKVILWNTIHPMNLRCSFQYQINTPIKVTNFNAYGGGYGTRGVVHPGNVFNADLGIEFSITQPWALCLDVVYSCTNSTKFHGNPGTTTDGGSTPASVGGGFSDQLSFAPAAEYNFNENMGLVWGLWFTVYGRNASNFVSGIFSWYWTFP